MKGYSQVICHNCGKQFWQNSRHVSQDQELGVNPYCSPKCSYASRRKTGRWLVCENNLCAKEFYRPKRDILSHHYCSQSCAAIVNNIRYPKWPKRYCQACNKEFKNRESKYCSSRCGYSVFRDRISKYTSETVQRTIKDLAKKLGRTPSRRELGKMSHGAIRLFESWNSAIKAAGLTPHRSHDHRMYKRSMTLARDGHKCDSISEAIIDNWLSENRIPHEREVHYPKTNHRADWRVGDVFIEYFGLANDSPRYDRAIKEKQKICRRSKIKLLEIYPTNLYPTASLDNKLATLRQ